MSTRPSEDAVETQSRMTDAARQQGTVMLYLQTSLHEDSEFTLDSLRD